MTKFSQFMEYGVLCVPERKKNDKTLAVISVKLRKSLNNAFAFSNLILLIYCFVLFLNINNIHQLFLKLEVVKTEDVRNHLNFHKLRNSLNNAFVVSNLILFIYCLFTVLFCLFVCVLFLFFVFVFNINNIHRLFL